MKRLLTLVLCILVLSLAQVSAAPSTGASSAVSLTYYGHSVFTLEKGDVKLIFDPYLTGNPWKAVTADEIEANYILVSHGHQDHLGDTVSIAKRTGAMVIATAELARMFKEQGVNNVHPMSIGGKKSWEFGYVRVTPAVHGAGVPGGVAAGFIVNFYGVNVYFAGDTALFGDMALLGKLERIDYALLPIGDNYTMGPDDAVEAAIMLKPQMVIPMHYNTNPLIQQSPEKFKLLTEKRTGIPVKVMQPGETIVLNSILPK